MFLIKQGTIIENKELSLCKETFIKHGRSLQSQYFITAHMFSAVGERSGQGTFALSDFTVTNTDTLFYWKKQKKRRWRGNNCVQLL